MVGMVASVVVCMVNGVSMVDQRWSMMEAKVYGILNGGSFYGEWCFNCKTLLVNCAGLRYMLYSMVDCMVNGILVIDQ